MLTKARRWCFSSALQCAPNPTPHPPAPCPPPPRGPSTPAGRPTSLGPKSRERRERAAPQVEVEDAAVRWRICGRMSLGPGRGVSGGRVCTTSPSLGKRSGCRRWMVWAIERPRPLDAPAPACARQGLAAHRTVLWLHGQATWCTRRAHTHLQQLVVARALPAARWDFQ